MDFVSIKSLKPNEYYSRFDHSKNVAYTAWKLSQDLPTTLAGAFHDVGSLLSPMSILLKRMRN